MKFLKEMKQTIKLFGIIIFLLVTLSVKSQVIHKDSIYLFYKDSIITNDSNNSFYLYKYHFYDDDFTITCSNYLSGQLKRIGSKYKGRQIGLYFVTYKTGRLKEASFTILDVEMGPDVEFYENGIIKRYFNYKFDIKDLNLEPKRKEIVEDDGFIIFTTFSIYYKTKNGIEYYYNTEGNVIKKDIWNNGTLIKTQKYDNKGMLLKQVFYNDKGKLIKQEIWNKDKLIETKEY